MKKSSGRISKVGVFVFFMAIVAALMPALMYKAGAESAENLIIVLSEENVTIVSRTSEMIKVKLGLELEDDIVFKHIQEMLQSENDETVESKVKRIVRNYRLPLSFDDQDLFIEYLQKKRIYFSQNSDKIVKYIDEYQEYLNGPISGIYLKVTGYPKKVILNRRNNGFTQ